MKYYENDPLGYLDILLRQYRDFLSYRNIQFLCEMQINVCDIITKKNLLIQNTLNNIDYEYTLINKLKTLCNLLFMGNEQRVIVENMLKLLYRYFYQKYFKDQGNLAKKMAEVVLGD